MNTFVKQKSIALISASILFCMSPAAKAGIWDSITGLFSDEEEQPVAEKVDTQAAELEAAEPHTETETAKADSGLLQQGLKLMPFLVQQLGISNDQAGGGLGALLQAASSMLPQGESSSLMAAIPGAQKYLDMVPSVADEKEPSLAGSALDVAGKMGKNAGVAKNLMTQFEALGMSSDMIPKFSQTTQKYLDQSDEGEASELLQQSLSGLF